MPTLPEYSNVLGTGGASTMEPIIQGLQSAVQEFIPVIIYVGLGVLIATLGFVAVKWLMNWTSAKVKGTFSSKRRRR